MELIHKKTEHEFYFIRLLVIVVCEWVRRNSELHPNASSVLKCVRLPLMNLNTLLETVRPTGLVEPNLILDAIYNQSKTPRVNIRYRGLLSEW